MKTRKFDNRKSLSLSHQLIKAGRLVNELGLAGARETFSLPGLKQTHLDLFPHIDFEGTSVTELADRKGVSKQAMSKLVAEMVDLKLLELKADPEDARAKKVFFKMKGPFAIYKGFKVLEGIDTQLKSSLGTKQYSFALRSLSDILQAIQEELE